MTETRTRFYKVVTTAPAGKGFDISLDGKAVRTPAGRSLVFPTHALAEAAAEEWRAQGPKIEPRTMPVTKLAYTAIDRVAPNPAQVAAQILAFGKSDVLCYRTEVPAELAAREAAAWDPLLEWAAMRYGAALKTATGIGFVAQPAEALGRFEGALAGYDDFALAALHGAATLLGSLVLALALAEGRLDAQEAFVLANLDEDYQAARWGRDAEAERRRLSRQAELVETERFLQLLRV